MTTAEVVTKCRHRYTFYYDKFTHKCEDCQALIKKNHDCFDEAVPVYTDGPLGHGWECGRCHAFVQAG